MTLIFILQNLGKCIIYIYMLVFYAKLPLLSSQKRVLTEFSCIKQQQSSSKVIPYFYVIILSILFYIYNLIKIGGARIFIFIL